MRQFDIYFIVIVAVALLIPLGIYMYKHAANEPTTAKEARIDRFAAELIEKAKEVHGSDDYSRHVLSSDIPASIQSIATEQDRLIITYDIGNGTVTAEYDLDFPMSFVPGEDRKVVVEKREGHVLACQGSACSCAETEECSNEIDDDCDNLIDLCDTDCGIDSDNDGVTIECGDCDDEDSLVYPENSEVCDGKDNDCSGSIDDGFVGDDCRERCEALGYVYKDDECCGDDAAYEAIETICDGYDNDCDGIVDGNLSRATDNQKGECEGNIEICARGDWVAHRDNHEPVQEVCNDGKDNDCDGYVDEGCTTSSSGGGGGGGGGGSSSDKKYYRDSDDDGYGDPSRSQTASSAPDGYVSNNDDCDDTDPEINPGESEICSTDVDEDCNGQSGYDDSDGREADESCQITMTDISVSDTSPDADTSITLWCTSSVANVNSIIGWIGSMCNLQGWSGSESEWTCNVGSAGTKTARCTLDPDVSYQSGSDQTLEITVSDSVCSGYTAQASCDADNDCEWCDSCQDGAYSGGSDRCVSSGNCNYACTIGECGADCTDTCNPTECDAQDGCYSGTYRDYSDVFNSCTNCQCTSNSCTDYTEEITDNDEDGYDTECDSDCNDIPASCGDACYPGAAEVCDGFDNDCNDIIDDGVCDSSSLALMTAFYPTIIQNHACALHNSMIYCFGGDEHIGTNMPQTTLITRYDPTSDSLSTMTAGLPMNNSQLSCAAANSMIYCFGGYSQTSECTEYDNESNCIGVKVYTAYENDILRYDPATDSITTEFSTLPSARKGHSCVTRSSTGRIYCFGGNEQGEGSIAQVFEFNPISGAVSLKSDMPEPRVYLSCAEDSANDLIYCFAGQHNLTRKDTIYRYDPTADSFTTMSAAFPVNITQMSCQYSSGRFYCFGGETLDSVYFNISISDMIYNYNPATDTIEPASASFTEGIQKTSCVAYSGNIYCIGGGKSVVYYNDIFEFSP